jgi:hypothetical protein
MADILAGYRTYLLTQSTVTTLTSTRIQFGYLGQKATLPAIVLNMVSGNRDPHFTGSNGLVEQRVSVNCYAATPNAATALAEAVRLVTDRYTGAWGSETVQGAFCEVFRSGFEPIGDGGQDHRQIVGFDVMVHHTEAAPTT